MDGFSPAREQDAWATIRGFVYQVELSLLRWLALEADQYLELEAGEDIDLISRALIESGEVQYSRKLEQVKVRAKRVTLRSASAIEALANAYSQRVANPHLDLRFCYTTNALVSCERPNPFPGRMSGINLWRELGNSPSSQDIDSGAIASLRSFFSSLTKPKRVPPDIWQGFLAFMQREDTAALLDFVQRFEWSCGQPAPESVAGDVNEKIRAVGNFTDELQTKEAYDRLFIYVLKLLTASGPKQLTTQSLREQLALPTLSATDHQLLELVRSRVSTLELRVGQIEDTVSSLATEVATLTQEVGGKFAAIELAGVVSVSAPPNVTRLSQRTKTVAELVKFMDSRRWLALHGGSDTGKTQLASLVSGVSPSFWIKCASDMSPMHAAKILDESLRSLLPTPPTLPSASEYEALGRRFESHSIVVLDDLPQSLGNKAFTERLVWLAQACGKVGVKVISTSLYRLPLEIAERLPPESILEIPAPQFTDEEVKEVFSAYGGSPSVLSSGTIRLINGLVSGHPLLITLAAQFLAQRNWALSEEDLAALFQGDHTAGIADEVLVRISQTLNQDQREMLYRLALSSLKIRDGVAFQLAEVAPAIPKAPECLATLIGAWVQRPEKNAVLVSPVARSVTQGNLSPDTFRKCNLTLGMSITAEAMDPWDAQIAIGHFVQADAPDLAGALFMSVLYEFNRRPYLQEFSSVLATWAEMPLPEKMTLSVKLMIRAMQFWVFPKYRRSDAFALNELDSLMKQATADDADAAYHVAALAALFLSDRDFVRAMHYFSQAMPLLRGTIFTARDLVLPRGKKPVEILWNSITNIGTAPNLELWKSAFEKLSADEKHIVKNSKDAELGCAVLANHLILIEQRKLETRRNWEPVKRALQDLQSWADKQEWGHLHACALVSEIQLHGDFLTDLDVCAAKVNAFLAREDRKEEAKGLVSGMYGKMLASNKRHSEAMPWLDRAINHPPAFRGHDWVLTLMAGVMCTPDMRRRRELAARAAAVTRDTPGISGVEKAKVFGELAIATLAGEATQAAAVRAYPVWAEFAEAVLGDDSRDEDWKSLFVMFGHAQAYFLRLARGVELPEHASDGSPYAAPYQGMFYTNHPDRAGLFRQESVAQIAWSQSLCARTMADEDAAAVWLQRSKEELDALPESYVTLLIQQEFIPGMLNADEFAEAMDRGYRGIETTAALKEAYDRQGASKRQIPPETSVDSLIAELSITGRKHVGQLAVTQLYFPALLRIACIAVTDRAAALDVAKTMTLLCKGHGGHDADREYCVGASRVFDAIYEEASVDKLKFLAHSFDENEQQPLRILAYFAVSMTDSLDDAFATQLASMQVVYAWHPPDTTINSQLLLPFMENYWQVAFQRQRFTFRSPAIVDHALAAAIKEDVKSRPLGILHAVHPGFKVTGLGDFERWLSSEHAKLTSESVAH